MRSILTFGVLLATASLTHAQTPRPAVETDASLFSGPAPVVASGSGGLAAMLFEDATTIPDEDLYLVASTNGGLTWSAPLLVSSVEGAKFLQCDSLHIVGTSAWCGYSTEIGMSGEEEFYVVEVNISVSPPVIVLPELLAFPGPSGPPAGQIRSYSFDVDAGGGLPSLGAAFAFDPGPTSVDEELWVVTAPPGGPPGTPVSPTGVAPGMFDVDECALAKDGSDFVVVWDDNRTGTDNTFLSINTAFGAPASWSAPIAVNGSAVDDTQDDLDVDVAGGTIFVAWLQEVGGVGDDEPFGRAFDTAGVAAGPEIPLTSVAGDADEIVGRVSAAGNLVAFFDHDRTGPDEIYAATSTTAGASFSPELVVSSAEGSFLCATTGADGVVAAAWSGFPTASPGVDAVESAYSCDDGVTFTTIADANSTGFDPNFVSIGYDPLKRAVLLGFQADIPPPPLLDAFATGYSVCTAASEAFRNAGTNPASLTVTSGADFGGLFEAEVDLTTTGHGAAVLFAFPTATNFTFGGGQTLLCLPSGVELFTGAGLFGLGPIASFSIPFPNDPCLIGFAFCVQAAHVDTLVVPFALSNARDCVAGATD